VASTFILVEVMMTGQSSYSSVGTLASLFLNSLTRDLTTKTAQYFSHRWNADFLTGKGRGRYVEKSKLLLAGLETMTLRAEDLTKLTLQIAPNHNQQLQGGGEGFL